MVGTPFQRALVIRGGALGDFLLTLPVLQSLREAAPSSRVELLAYPGLGALAKNAGMVDEVRSIEYGPMAGFFTRGAVLDPALREYFGSFDLIVSYLYDPDAIFRENLRGSGAQRVVIGPHRPGAGAHAIDQLAAPLADLGLPLRGRAGRIGAARVEHDVPTVAIHPGSGSAAKNWPVENWRQLVRRLLADSSDIHVAVIGGEADAPVLAALRDLAVQERVVFWENLDLADLAGRLAGAQLYLGHDTGISHLAAAAGAPSLLLFGPTDPGVWSPPHDHVRVLRAPEGRLENLAVNTVAAAARPLIPGRRLATGDATPDNAAP